jgi:hypothetical protein
MQYNIPIDTPMTTPTPTVDSDTLQPLLDMLVDNAPFDHAISEGMILDWCLPTEQDVDIDALQLLPDVLMDSSALRTIQQYDT